MAHYGHIWPLSGLTAISDEPQTFFCQMGHLGAMWLSTVRGGHGSRIGPCAGSAPLTPLPRHAFWPPVLGGGQSSMLGRCEAVTLLVGGLFRRFLARSKAARALLSLALPAHQWRQGRPFSLWCPQSQGKGGIRGGSRPSRHRLPGAPAAAACHFLSFCSRPPTRFVYRTAVWGCSASALAVHGRRQGHSATAG